MWSRTSKWYQSFPVIAALAMTGPACGDNSKPEISEETAKICATAAARYAELYPDANDDGVHVILLYKYNFCPATKTIKVGETVRWVNVDKRTSHSVWLKEAGQAESERFFPEEQWETTFSKAGNYPYLCGPHWESDNMRGSVTVVD